MGRELRGTYRLQLSPGFGFAQARDLVPYLERLGISHLYLSPILQARRGSQHGYDVVDPGRVSEELGGEEQLRALAGAAREAGMGLILDVVPNHMGVGPENRFWREEGLRERFFDLDPAGGYRRFFDIDDMAAIRQEREDVFEASHEKILGLVSEGIAEGLRVDHPDGLADPAGYLRRLRERGVERIWVEKILHAGSPPEHLRDWPVRGSVGYEFMNEAGSLFVDPTGQEALTQLLEEVAGERRGFARIARQAQLEVARLSFERDFARLERLGPFDREQLERAMAGLPVYRTYVEPWSGRVAPEDREAVAQAGMEEELARILLLQEDGLGFGELVTRFQQTSPAIAAKGIEDTAFYRYPRLLSLNEVGGNPLRFGLSVWEMHEQNLERAERFPEGLLATQTHDTKRSADVRARIGALAGMADEWCERVRTWRALAEPLRGPLGGPDGYEELTIYQTLVGARPIAGERVEAYLIKAMREAKRNSSWAEPNEPWEREVVAFARGLLASTEFMAEFEPFAARVAGAGERSTLGQVLLKLTCPGVPDIYQGDELLNLSLVDPDNRRPVDWELRRGALERLRAGGPDALAQWGGAGGGLGLGARKLRLIERALDLRGRRPEAFAGSYRPLQAEPGVLGFQREDDVLVLVRVDMRAVPAAGRGAPEVDGLPKGLWRDVLSGRELRLDGSRRTSELLDGDGIGLFERASWERVTAD